MKIIHITFDYPDSIDAKKTKAVKNLISTQESSDSIVFSLNRTFGGIFKPVAKREKHGYTLSIFGFPMGILLSVWMFFAYLKISKILNKDGIKPDLIHAHKLTFEGIIAYFLSKKYRVPYLITVRGDTDIKVLHYKRLCNFFYKRIVLSAKKIIFLAPWTVNAAEKYLGNSYTDKYTVLPNIISVNQNYSLNSFANKTFVTVFNFDVYKRKNIERVILAFNEVFKKFPECKLDIIGEGSARNKILSMIRRSKNPENFTLRGSINHELLLAEYSKYDAFILPSYPETFGLVFMEALAAGIPIIYSKGAGIDGFFNNFGVGIAVDHESVKDISEAICDIISNLSIYKSNVLNLISQNYLNTFSGNSVGMRYKEILTIK